MTNKELEVLGCRTFVCPNLGIIDQKGKELQLKDTTIKRAKEMAIGYFKKTYSKPHYSSARHLLPSFIYIASVLEGERRFQMEIAVVFGTTHSTIIVDTMGITITCDNMKSDRYINRKRIKAINILEKKRKVIYPDLDLIEEGGKKLGLDYWIIKRAKDLAIRYFNNAYHRPRYPISTKTVMP